MPTPSSETQGKALKIIQDYREESADMTQEYRQRLLRVYRSYKTFREGNYGETMVRGRTDFKVNKAHEVVEKVLVRIIGRDPRWIVTPRDIGSFANDNEQATTQTQVDVNGQPTTQSDYSKPMRDRAAEWSACAQDYLTYVFDEYNQRERFKLLARNLIVYGKAYAKTTWKYETARISKVTQKTTNDVNVDPNAMTLDPTTGEPVVQDQTSVQDTTVSEKVIGQYPSIDVISWTDMYYDPRYIFIEDRPAMVQFVESVRYKSLLQNKKDYFNLDQLEGILTLDPTLDSEQYKQRVRQITGIMELDPKVLKQNSLDITKYYGFFSKTGEAKDEKLYEMWSVNDTVLIKMQEITKQPIQEVKCFEDPESSYATGFVEPIISLQEELNWKKNSASEYINQMLTRRFIWSPYSGINPKDVMNPIIPTTKTGDQALLNFPELKLSEIHPSYFQEENDFERQIQGMTFTVDTSNQQNQQALTNTATGARIKFFESNAVIDEVRKTFEKFLERVAYAMLMETFENMDDNIVFKKQGTDDFWHANKEFLRNAVQRYSIKVEAGSSSYNDLETRREEAIAFFNLASTAKQMGVDVNLDNAYKDTVQTFEKKDPMKYLQPVDPHVMAMKSMGMLPGQSPSSLMASAPQRSSYGPADLTAQVAGGKNMLANLR